MCLCMDKQTKTSCSGGGGGGKDDGDERFFPLFDTIIVVEEERTKREGDTQTSYIWSGSGLVPGISFFFLFFFFFFFSFWSPSLLCNQDMGIYGACRAEAVLLGHPRRLGRGRRHSHRRHCCRLFFSHYLLIWLVLYCAVNAVFVCMAESLSRKMSSSAYMSRRDAAVTVTPTQQTPTHTLGYIT